VIKLHKHRLTCSCADCRAMFPPDRHDAVWAAPDPGDGARRAVGRVPIGAVHHALEVLVWVTPDDRLAVDWPGFPGTRGAQVTLKDPGPGQAPVIVATRDPALAALGDALPLRRALVERVGARCMVEFGLAAEETADFVRCDRHGLGASALACACVAHGAEPRDVTIVYGLDGDYPDVFCAECLPRYAAGDLDVCVTVCSHCQQLNLYRHHIVATTHYGARPEAP